MQRTLGSIASMSLLAALAGCGGAAQGGGACREGAPVACVCEDGRHGTGMCGVSGCDCPYALAAEPASLDFGEVRAGESGEAAVALHNPAPRAVTLRSIEWLGAEPGVYAFAGELPAAIPAGGSVSLAVRFVPTAPGSHVARVRVEAADPDVAPVEVIVSGRTPGPVLSCSPAELVFDGTWLGETATAAVVCTNVGLASARDEARLPLSTPAASGPGFSAAWLAPPPAEGLGVGESAAIEVRFSPAEAGEHSGTLTVAGAGAAAELPLFAFASETPACDVEVLPRELRMGVVAPGTLELSIRNRRPDAPCTVRDVRLCEGTDPAFSLGETRDGIVIPGGGELRIPVDFAPGVDSCRGEGSGCVEFELSPSPDGHRSVPLSCERQDPSILVSPAALDFGSGTARCFTHDREVEIINPTSVPVHFERIELAPGTSEEFFVRSQPPAGTPIPLGRAVVVTLAYRSRDEGTDTGTALVRIREQPEPVPVSLWGGALRHEQRTDAFQQCIRPRADVLVVVDNGTGMTGETSHVVTELGTLPDRFGRDGIHARLAVTTTGLIAGGSGCPGGVNGGEDGRFFPVDGSRPRIVDETTPDRLATWQANLAVGTCHAAPPQALEATIRALTPPLSTSADDPRHPEPNDGNLGFLRPDAHLVVFAVSDRADVSPGTDDAYYQALVGAKGGRSDLVHFHAITGDSITGCSTADGRAAAAGDRLIGLARRTAGGTFASICGALGPGYPDFGDNVAGCRGCFSLSRAPEDRDRNGAENDLRVTIDGLEVPSSIDGEPIWRFSRDENAVCFDPLHVPGEGTRIEVTYAADCVSW